MDDCFAATQWVAEHAQLINADVERLAVGGDSAGGNLAAVTALMARDRGFPRIMSQLLLYPATDAKAHTPSSIENATGYFLTKDLMQWFYGHYLHSDEEKDDFRVSPLRARDLKGLPGALIVTAEYDPLRDEGEAYGMRLVEGGSTVTLKRYLGQIHGFCANLAGVMDVGKEALDMAGRFLRESFRAGWSPRSWF